MGGSWVPISMFPKWVQSISEWTPVYHVNELVVNFAINGNFHGNHFCLFWLIRQYQQCLHSLSSLIEKAIEVKGEIMDIWQKMYENLKIFISNKRSHIFVFVKDRVVVVGVEGEENFFLTVFLGGRCGVFSF